MQRKLIRIISLILMVVSFIALHRESTGFPDRFGKPAAVVNVVFHLCLSEYYTLAERGQTPVICADGHLVLCVCCQHCSRNIDCNV